MSDPLISRLLGKYQIQQVIGRGGMARVYRATDTVLQRPVALKVLAPSLSADPEFARRFEREAITAANLRHPAIVTIFDVGEADGLRYIAMEYIGGRTLSEVLEERGRLSIPLTIAILGPVAEALDFAHSHGMVHRDVKPHNIMIDVDGRVLLTDFGIAIDPSETSERLTRTGMFMGTPEYISPEQAQAQPLTGRSDQYSLGIVAYEMLAGRVPFDGGTPQQIMAHVYQMPPRLNGFDPAMPPELDQIFARVLAKDPNQRFDRTGLLVEALRYVARRYNLPIASRDDVAGLAIPQSSSAGQATVAMHTPPGVPVRPQQGTQPPTAQTPPAQNSATGAPFPIAEVFGNPNRGGAAAPQQSTAPIGRTRTGTPPSGTAVPPRQTGSRGYPQRDQYTPPPPPRIPPRRTYNDDGGSNVPWTFLAIGAVVLLAILLIGLISRGNLFASGNSVNPFERTITPTGAPTVTAEPTNTPLPFPTLVPGQPSLPPETVPTPTPEATLEPTAEPPTVEPPTPEPPTAEPPTITATPEPPTAELPTVTATPEPPTVTATPEPPTITPTTTATQVAVVPTTTPLVIPTLTPLPPGVPTPIGGGAQLAFFEGNTLFVRDQFSGTPTDQFMLQLEVVGPSAISPDGSTILLDLRDAKSGRQIYLWDRNGAPVQLTSAGNNLNPSWRPDGNAIVFASDRNGTLDLFTMAADGSNQQPLTSTQAADSYPSYSPDGSTIVFQSAAGGANAAIFTISPDGGTPTRVSSDDPNIVDRSPRWSPDGTAITFVSNRDRPDGGFEVYTQSIDKLLTTRVTTFTNGSADGPVWSPDGSLIAFFSNSAGTNDIYIADINTDSLLTSPASKPDADERWPAWSR